MTFAHALELAPTPTAAPAATSSDVRPARQLDGVAAFVAHYLLARPVGFAAVLLLVTSAAACAVLAQYAMKLLVDALASPQGHAGVRRTLGLFMALIAGEMALWRLSGWVGCRTTVRTGVDIRADLFEHVAAHPLRWFQEHLAGALGHRITAMAGHFGGLFNRLAWEVAPPLVNFAGALGIFWGIDPRLALTVALFTAAATAAMIVLGRRGAPLHRAHAREGGRVGGEVIDLLSNAWLLKAFSAARRERAKLERSFAQEAHAHERSWMQTERMRAVNDLGLVGAAGLTLLMALALWERGEVTAGDVVVVSALTFRLLHGSRDLAFSLLGARQSWTYMEETLEVLGRPHAVRDPDSARPLRRGGGDVRFEGVTFGYSEGRPVLDRVDLHIPAGQKVGLVGASGAGKSTLLSLMLRLHDPEEGRVLIDGQDVASVRQDDLRAAMAVVPQEVSLFHRSLRENIRFARPDASDGEVEHAARAAGCHDFAQELAEGYDTAVGERGANLSGGQRQRVGIARAFLKDTRVLLLDEATSALDTRAELAVQAALDRLMQGRTVIAVAHRLSTLADFDRVLVLQDGRIVEDGPPGELLRRGGAFAHAWRMQLQQVETAGVRAPAAAGADLAAR